MYWGYLPFFPQLYNLLIYSVPACVAHLNPVELVSEIADKVVLKIVKNVCHEAVDENLVQRLVQAELIAS